MNSELSSLAAKDTFEFQPRDFNMQLQLLEYCFHVAARFAGPVGRKQEGVTHWLAGDDVVVD